MSFYKGGPFVERQIMPAQKADICPACDKPWREGQDIRMIVEEPFRNKIDWRLMHIPCAAEHPMNVNNMKDDVIAPEALDPNTYGAQRDAIRFVMDHGTAIVTYDAHRQYGQRFGYRVYEER